MEDETGYGPVPGIGGQAVNKAAAHLRAGSLAGRGVDVGYVNSTSPADVPPFTALAMQHLHASTQQASDIASRLYELRDRLFGPQPANTIGGSGEKQVPPMGFADAYSRLASEHVAILGRIDSLTNEIANRL